MVARQSKIFAGFRDWLKADNYSDSAISQYSVAVRLALGLLDKPSCEIDPAADLDQVRTYLTRRFDKASTLATYHKSLVKLADYLRQCQNQPPPSPEINWDKYLGLFPALLADDIRAYVLHRRRAWLPERWHTLTLGLLDHLTDTLRGLIGDIPNRPDRFQKPVRSWPESENNSPDLSNLTPARWFKLRGFTSERWHQADHLEPGTVRPTGFSTFCRRIGAAYLRANVKSQTTGNRRSTAP